MVTKLIVNGETAIVGSSGSAKGLRIDFIGTDPILSDELPIEVSVGIETIYSTDLKIGEHLNGLFLYRGELVIGDCEITAVFDAYVNTNLVEISHTGMGGFYSLVTSSEQLEHMSAGAYMPNVTVHKSSMGTYVAPSWAAIGDKIFAIFTDGDGDESVYANTVVMLSETDIPFAGATFGMGQPFYILWLHRENEDSPYKCYLGTYRIGRIVNKKFNFERTQDLIPLFTPNDEAVSTSSSIPIQIIFDRDDYSKTYTVSAGDEVYTGTVPADLAAFVNVKKPNTEYQITCEDASKTVVSGSENGITTTVVFGNVYIIYIMNSMLTDGTSAFDSVTLDGMNTIYDSKTRRFMGYCGNPGYHDIGYRTSDNIVGTVKAFISDTKTEVIIPVYPKPDSVTMDQVNEAIDAAITGAINASY